MNENTCTVMSKKGKTYRGQRYHYNPCGCFYCTGYNKKDRYRVREKEDLKQMKEDVNNINIKDG